MFHFILRHSCHSCVVFYCRAFELTERYKKCFLYSIYSILALLVLHYKNIEKSFTKFICFQLQLVRTEKRSSLKFKIKLWKIDLWNFWWSVLVFNILFKLLKYDIKIFKKSNIIAVALRIEFHLEDSFFSIDPEVYF